MIEPLHTAPPLLAAHALAFSRNEEPVFGPLDFHVDAGEALLVQGDNGAGKTTLLRVLAGLHVEHGQIQIDGKTAKRGDRSRFMAYHLPGLKADLSTLENLHFLCGLHGRRAQADARQCAGHRRPGRLRRCAGAAVVGRPTQAPGTGTAGCRRRRYGCWTSPTPIWIWTASPWSTG